MALEFDGVKFYTTMEVSELLEINVQTVRGYVRSEKLKGQRVGKSFLISEKNLREFMKVDHLLDAK